ncbi:hypothetical protein Bca4012_016914 [Brassica carinata]
METSFRGYEAIPVNELMKPRFNLFTISTTKLGLHIQYSVLAVNTHVFQQHVFVVIHYHFKRMHCKLFGFSLPVETPASNPSKRICTILV